MSKPWYNWYNWYNWYSLNIAQGFELCAMWSFERFLAIVMIPRGCEFQASVPSILCCRNRKATCYHRVRVLYQLYQLYRG
jgi:hypothetical protein